MTKKHRPIPEIENDLRRAREQYAREGPTHSAVTRCEHFQKELAEAMDAEEGE